MAGTFAEKFEQALAEKREQEPGYGLRTLARTLAKGDPDAVEYHADQIDPDRPSLSASIACVLIAKSPAHAYTQHPRLNPAYVKPEEKKAWDIGTAAHSLLLEGYANVHVVEGCTDWRTKDAKAEADQARAQGKIPMLRHEWERVSAMVDMAREDLAAWDIDPAPLTDGSPEKPLSGKRTAFCAAANPTGSATTSPSSRT
jgi:hypothetical protein